MADHSLVKQSASSNDTNDDFASMNKVLQESSSTSSWRQTKHIYDRYGRIVGIGPANFPTPPKDAMSTPDAVLATSRFLLLSSMSVPIELDYGNLVKQEIQTIPATVTWTAEGPGSAPKRPVLILVHRVPGTIIPNDWRAGTGFRDSVTKLVVEMRTISDTEGCCCIGMFDYSNMVCLSFPEPTIPPRSIDMHVSKPENFRADLWLFLRKACDIAKIPRKPVVPLASGPTMGLKKPVHESGSVKVRRNDPCSCKSGKKYKKCCGA